MRRLLTLPLQTIGRFFEAGGGWTITFNWEMLAFLPMVGINIATMSLVGKYLGAGEREVAVRVAFSSLKLAWSYVVIMSSIFLLFTSALVGFFQQEGQAELVQQLSGSMLQWACVYLLFDAAYLVFSGVLKGAGDTVWSMWTSGMLIMETKTTLK